MENNKSQILENVDDVRRSVKFHATVWGDYFLPYDATEETSADEIEEHKRLTEKVRELLISTTAPNNDISITNKLEIIDAIQRLGVAYHFQNEIEKSLKMVYDDYLTIISNNKVEDNLHLVSLRFRLLRQKTYHVLPEDALSKFIGPDGKLKGSLIDKDDILGLLSLYEASHYGVHEEKILDDAFKFSSLCLVESLSHHHNKISSKSLKEKVNEAVKFPIRKSLPRVAARKFISMYEDDESHDEILLKFAKLDFNLLQKSHQQELSDVTRWKKALNYDEDYSFARDRVVECYLWASAVSFEPQFHYERKMLTKMVVMITLMDDIFDIYGTIDDLQLLTNAVQRWDISAMEQLPTYMRQCYRTLLDVYAELEDYERAEIVGKPYRFQFVKKEFIIMVIAYMEEAKWLYTKYKPTMEDYRRVGAITGDHSMMLNVCLVCIGNLITNEEFDLIVSHKPLILLATNVIARLMDDMAGYGSETKISAVDCYMNEKDCSEEVAFRELEKEVSNAWKDINVDCLKQAASSSSIAKPVLDRILNFARMSYLVYTDHKDVFTDSTSKMKECIRCLYVDPVGI